MKEEPNIDETIHKIEQILEDKRHNIYHVHAGTLMDILALLKEQKNRIEVLERIIERMPKPVKLLDVFGDNYEKIVRCKDCKHRSTSQCPCQSASDPYYTWDPDDEWFCADGERR